MTQPVIHRFSRRRRAYPLLRCLPCALLYAACARNPCPSGSVINRAEDRCVTSRQADPDEVIVEPDPTADSKESDGHDVVVEGDAEPSDVEDGAGAQTPSEQGALDGGTDMLDSASADDAPVLADADAEREAGVELETGVSEAGGPPVMPRPRAPLPTWEQVSGSALLVAVAANGDVWSIGVQPDPSPPGRHGVAYSVAKREAGDWLRVESPGAVDLALEPTGVPWIVNNQGELLRGSDATRTPTWTTVPAPCALQLAIGTSGDRWMVDCDGRVLKWQTGAWQDGSAPLTVKRLAVAPSGIPWIVDVVDRVYERASNDPAQHGWIYRVGTGGQDVTVAPDGRVFILGDFIKSTGYLAKYLSRDEAWVPLDESIGGLQIAAGPQDVWLVDMFARTFRLDASALE
jgi:hypothetical protein